MLAQERLHTHTHTHTGYLLSSQVFKNTDRLVRLPSLHVTRPLF